MRQYLLAIVISAYAITAHADPLLFRGVEFGVTPFSEAKVLIMADVQDGMHHPTVEQRYCTKSDVPKAECSFANIVYGPANLKSVTITGREEKITALRGYFDARSFDSLVRLMQEKFGTVPCKTSEVSNRMGAKFEGVECEWVSGGVIVTAKKFSYDLVTSSVSFETAKERETSLAEFEAAQQKKKSAM